MGSIHTSNFRRNRKLNLINVCGGKCNICGYNILQDALEFHHIFPENKKYSIAKNGTCHNLEEDINEAKKCILVCANCHREIHKNLYTSDQLLNYQVFDENMANLLIQDRDAKYTKQHYYCKQCNNEITRYSKSGLCEKCYKQSTRLVERPSRQDLKNMIRKMPFTQIAIKYNVTDNAIRKWCKAENLPTKKKDINQFSDVDWEKI